MFYYERFIEVYSFWRDNILQLFYSCIYTSHEDYIKGDKIKFANENHKIIGVHKSKSILNPVMELKYKDCTITIRYNFNDYEIAIQSLIELKECLWVIYLILKLQVFIIKVSL